MTQTATTQPSEIDAAGPGMTEPISRVRTRLGMVLVSHGSVDFYAQMFPPLLAVLESRCNLTSAQSATLLGLGPLASGVSQPVAAWLSDRLDSRLFGPLGLVVGAVSLSLIGLADDFRTILVFYVIGIIGTGVYHPIGASSIGHLGEQMIGRHGSRRANALSLFFVAGMIGGIAGATYVPKLVSYEHGSRLLYFAMIPGLAIAIALQRAIRRVPHRQFGHKSVRFEPDDARKRWFNVGLLYVSAAMRFTVNIALFYLVVRWAQSLVAEAHPDWATERVNKGASQINGTINGAVIVGMLIGGLSAGWLIRPGREKWPLVFAPLVGVPALALFPMAEVWAGRALAVLAGIGFAAMVPVTMSVAQRLLPHRTSLASGLMLGGAWSMAFLGPIGAQYCLEDLKLSLETTFGIVAGLLATAGLVCTGISKGLLNDSHTNRSAANGLSMPESRN